MKGVVLVALLTAGCAHWINCHFGGTQVELPCYCADNEPYHGACPVDPQCSCTLKDNPTCVPPPGGCSKDGTQ